MNIDELNDHFDRIIAARHHDPFQVLGVHDGDRPENVVVRAFQPHAETVYLVSGGDKKKMERIRPEGLFALQLPRSFFPDPGLDPYTYQFEIVFYDGNSLTINDTYRVLPQLGELDRYLFNFGTDYRLYDHLGAHLTMLHKIAGTIFRVWAPNAARVSVVGNFNAWDGRVHPMRSLGASGVWELFIPGLAMGELYKYEIRAQEGYILLKADPLQFYGELRPNTASIVCPLDRHIWQDEAWQKHKRESQVYQRPMTIYEAHAGSWRRDPNDPERFLTFSELADQLIPYVREMGFTHIELLPVMEHPLDESWGYQVTATFSLTSRYGTPEEFMDFVDRCHQAGIGVILDWVPAHFPRDSHSLSRFDGTALYEHADPRRGAHPEWGTLIYNYGRREVSNYLIANALFWLDKYHIDGLRVDAVASMLYLDYSRKAGEWIPNCYGGRENLEAIEFLRHANSVIFANYPNTLMIAEESTSFYGVSKPADQGGLGFGFKWNMGWMNDFLAYFSKDTIYRRFHHNSLTFSLMYAFSENFILPLSHDEVVHGKRSLIDKMPGDLWQKFANMRLLLLTMWAHPGKKLLFMGGEFGQWSEWYCKTSLDWHLLEGSNQENPHKQLQYFTAELNRFYLEQPALWQRDFAWQGFKWLDFSDTVNSVISFARFAEQGDDHLVAVLNFTPQTLADYRIGLPSGRSYKMIFCSDDKRFGGAGLGDERIIKAEKKAQGQAEFSAALRIPPLAGCILQPQ
ncbi:MAG: 1,4-alpha-glucan branching protein GlgB [Desulfobulbaceae bacterium]|jgi:1,4-alpha-glucan branching enzyme|nr:1,4-alpha-glucan branching protein GlgB [Desulfobulbaceae bacterium]